TVLTASYSGGSGNDFSLALPAAVPAPQPAPTVGDGDPQFRLPPLSPPVVGPTTPLQPQVPTLPAAPEQFPLAPAPLFEPPTLGSGIPSLGTVFSQGSTPTPSFIAQVFSDRTGDGSGHGFLGFGGGDGGVFGSSSLSSIFASDPLEELERQGIFGANQVGGQVFGAPTLGQQLQALHQGQQREVEALAQALGQFPREQLSA
ncbi:MAG: hypothetical protein AAGC84_18395, partial [Pseudomonas sp.]